MAASTSTPATTVPDKAPAPAQIGHILDQQHLALLQLCFDEREVSDEEFDPVAFVGEKQQYVPLDTLAKDLRTFSSYLDQRIVKHIHDDVHEAFVAISGQLVGMEGQVRQTHAPLLEIQQRVGQARIVLEEKRAVIASLVDDARRLERERTFYTGLVQIVLMHNTACDIVEQIVWQTPTPPVVTSSGSGPTSPASRGTGSGGHNDEADAEEAMVAEVLRNTPLLQRAACEVQQMMDVCNECVPPSDAAAEEYATYAAVVAEAAAAFGKLLDDAMVRAYRAYIALPASDRTAALVAVLEVYQQLGDSARWCAHFRDSIVRPIVEDVVPWKASATAKQDPAEAQRLVQGLCDRLTRDVLPIVPLARRIFGKEGSAVLHTGIWPAIADTIQKRMRFLFVASLPNAFHKNFCLAHRVTALLEAVCSTPEELADLRHCPDSAMWMKEWNMEVYHTLRVDEFNGKLAPSAVVAGASATFHNASLTRLVAAVQWLLSPDVLLYPLAAKFARDAVHAIRKALVVLADPSGAHAGAPPPTSPPLDVLSVCRAVNDVKIFSTTFAGVTLPALLAAATKESVESLPALAAVATLVGQMCTNTVNTMAAALSKALIDSTMTKLSHIKSVKSAYTMTKRLMATERSAYLTGALDSIAAFRNTVRDAKMMTDAEVSTIVVGVLTELSRLLHGLVKEILVSARKAQESLDKLKKRSAAGVSAAAAAAAATPAAAGSTPGVRPTMENATDRDKIVVQLYLDIHEFGSMMRPLGVHKESFAPLQPLLKLVRRANWILGDDIPEPAEIEEAD